jgi:hypothetical protein
VALQVLERQQKPRHPCRNDISFIIFSFAVFICRKKVAAHTNRMNTIIKLRQQSSELKDELARMTEELRSNLVMTETVTSPTQVELKRVGRGGKWQPWVIQYICELLVIGTPPASIPSIISSSYQTYYGKEADEVPQVRFVRGCRVIVQVIGETIAAIKLASAEKWDQLWTDATTRRQCPFQALIIGLMDSEKKLDPVTVSSCIFLEDESAETTVESILAKVSGIVRGIVTWVFIRELRWRREFRSYDKNPDVNVDANDEAKLFLSRTEAVLSISAALEPST